MLEIDENSKANYDKWRYLSKFNDGRKEQRLFPKSWVYDLRDITEKAVISNATKNNF